MNWDRHFYERDEAERAAFGEPPMMQGTRLKLPDVNTAQAAAFVRERDPELVLIFGTGMIKEPLLSALPAESYNLHLGISPRYRGAATLFWPQYFLEPQFAGCTFHRIVPEPDAGDILHQCRPMMRKDDGIHDISARAVTVAAGHMAALIAGKNQGVEWALKRQKNTGKCFLASDFQPQHLRLIYDVYDNHIAGAYLDGEIESKAPQLYTEVYDACISL